MNRLHVVAFCILSFGMVPVSGAAPPPADPESKPNHVESTTVARPQARPWTPKPQEQAGVMRTTTGLSAVRLANGATAVAARGRYREFVVASVDERGTLRVGCVHGERAVRGVLEGRAQAAPARFEEQ